MTRRHHALVVDQTSGRARGCDIYASAYIAKAHDTGKPNAEAHVGLPAGRRPANERSTPTPTSHAWGRFAMAERRWSATLPSPGGECATSDPLLTPDRT